MAEKQKYTVFLVDDDTMYLRILEDSLKQHKYCTLKSFTTGKACLENLNLDPQIIVLDYYLESGNPTAVDGLEILKKIKKTHPNTEIIMLSGQEKIEVAVNCVKFGAFDYVVKNESTTVRLQNVIANVVHNIKLKKQLKENTFWTKIVIVVIVSIIILSLMLYNFFPELFRASR